MIWSNQLLKFRGLHPNYIKGFLQENHILFIENYI